jgi:hypothetical protein
VEASTIELIQAEYDRGRADACKDVADGTRKMYVQTRGAWGRFLFELMRDRYGIFVEHVSDITSAAKLSYEGGYNSITHEYVENMDGVGTMDRIHAEVDAFRAEHYRKYFEANPPPEKT